MHKKTENKLLGSPVYIQIFQQKELLAQEQHAFDFNPLYTLTQKMDRYSHDI